VIYPSARAVLACGAGAVVTLALAAVAPDLWLLGGAWVVGLLALLLADALLAGGRRRLNVVKHAPEATGLGRPASVNFELAFARGRAPTAVEAALEVNARLTAEAERIAVSLSDGAGAARFVLRPNRRGEGRLERLWVRWRGPMGLVWKQRDWEVDHALAITPDLQGVTDEAARLFSRDADYGMKVQLETGAGSEFHALREFTTGHDRRIIDWKQSARHGQLLAKEFRTERNHPLVLALDAGRTMSEPIGGVPRIDRAINASLLLAYAGLKMGDRVALFSFDSAPRITTGAVSGAGGYPLLQRLASRVDYSTEETNYTLGLTRLSADLERRSLIVVFTEFADAVSAGLMIENLGRLMQRHVVLFVAFRDEELEQLANAEPLTPEDVSRAVVAASLLRSREAVLNRLRRLGAEIVEAPADRLGPALLNGYLDIKRRERL
jgi:uncharacterized protein (DUF58 family)